MEDLSDFHNYLLATPESFRKLRYVPETVEEEVEAPKKRSIPGEDVFIEPIPLWSSTAIRNTRFRGSEGHLEDSCRDGGGNLLVAGPGSLTVTGPTRVEVGAKGKLGAVAVEEDLLRVRGR